eukprot:SM000059S18720  [mRNA]  locus=s59:648565:656554:+ [translate_table: standard]
MLRHLRSPLAPATLAALRVLAKIKPDHAPSCLKCPAFAPGPLPNIPLKMTISTVVLEPLAVKQGSNEEKGAWLGVPAAPGDGPRWTVGTYISARLVEANVGHVFVVPSGYSLPLLKQVGACPRLWCSFHLQYCCNELNAGYFSDGYARMGGVGAICVTYGTGSVSALNAIAGAYAHNLQIVLLSGAPSSEDLASTKILPNTTGETDKCQAFRMYKEVTCDAVQLRERHPVLLVGPKARAAIVPVQTALAGVAEALGCKLAVTFDAKGLFQEDHPAFAGTYMGHVSSPPSCREVVERADTIMAVGPYFTDLLTIQYSLPWSSHRLIQVMPDAVKLPDCEYPAVCMVDFLGLLAEKLHDMKEETSKSTQARKLLHTYEEGLECAEEEEEGEDPRCAEIRARAVSGYGLDDGYSSEELVCVDELPQRDSFTLFMGSPSRSSNKDVKGSHIEAGGSAGDAAGDLEDMPLGPEECAEGEDKELMVPPVVVPEVHKSAETGSAPQKFHPYGVRLGTPTTEMPVGVDPARKPQAELLTYSSVKTAVQVQSVHMAMGWSLPATLGMAVSRPGRRFVSVTNEHSLQMTAQELSTAMELGVKPIIFVLNTGSRAPRSDGLNLQLSCPSWQYHKLIEVLGTEHCTGKAFHVSEQKELEAAMKAADLDLDGPLLITGSIRISVRRAPELISGALEDVVRAGIADEGEQRGLKFGADRHEGVEQSEEVGEREEVEADEEMEEEEMETTESRGMSEALREGAISLVCCGVEHTDNGGDSAVVGESARVQRREGTAGQHGAQTMSCGTMSMPSCHGERHGEGHGEEGGGREEKSGKR